MTGCCICLLFSIAIVGGLILLVNIGPGKSLTMLFSRYSPFSRWFLRGREKENILRSCVLVDLLHLLRGSVDNVLWDRGNAVPTFDPVYIDRIPHDLVLLESLRVHV